LKYCATLSFLFLSLSAYGQNSSDALSCNNQIGQKDTSEQKDIITFFKKMPANAEKKKKNEEGKKVYFTLLPYKLTPPTGGIALISSTSAGFYLGKVSTTFLSTASFTPYWNFGNQFGLPLRTEIWKEGNTWLSLGDIRFLFYPQNSWGLGNDHPESEPLLIHYKYFRFYLNALKRLKPYFWVGFGFNIDYHLDIYTPKIALAPYAGYFIGTDQNSNSYSA
jgi:hypothetical protein